MTMGATLKDLEKAESLFHNQVQPNEWRFLIIPTPIAALEAPSGKKRDEFVKVVLASRVSLFHMEWAEACSDARILSETGGVQMVSVATFKPSRCNIMEMYVNGNSTRRKK